MPIAAGGKGSSDEDRNGHEPATGATVPATQLSAAGLIGRFVPIVSWLPRYQWSSFPADAVAGITIWGLLIPEMIAYAGLAGLPPEAGLYTLLASLVVYAVFGTSRQLVVAGTSASAVLVLSAVTALGPHDAKTYATLASGFIVLTGLIFVVAGLLKLGFIKVGEMQRFYQLAPREFWLGMLTLGGVITLDVLPGLIIGVVLSILLLVYRGSRLRLSVLGTDSAFPGAYADTRRHSEAQPLPNILIVRPDGPLFYANAQSVHDGIETLVSSSTEPIHTVIVDLDANDELDITSSEQLDKLIQALHAQSIRVGLAHVHRPALDMARRSGVLDQVGAAHIFPTVAAAVAWAQSGAGDRPSDPAG